MNVVLTVGNSMMGDDGAGPLLTELLTQQPIPGWEVVDGGSAPENHVHQVLALKPQHVVLVDAAEMGLTPGDVRIVDEKSIAELFIMTTHNLPLSFLIERIKETGVDVTFLGIEPSIVAFSFPMSEAVRKAVESIYAHLRTGTGAEAFARL